MVTNLVWDCETTGLIDNLFERIICISVHNINKNEILSFVGEDEGKIIEDFYSYIKTQDSPNLIGFNSQSFDLPFMVRRSVIYKKRIPVFTNTDLRKVANGFFYSYNPREKGKLSDWAMALGMKVDTSPGSEMFKLYSEKKFDEIKKHCEEDISITLKLFEHCQACGLVNGNGNGK